MILPFKFLLRFFMSSHASESRKKNFDILCKKMTSCAGGIDSIVKSTYNSKNELQQNIKSYGGTVSCRKKDT